jgi:hypothetical protein
MFRIYSTWFVLCFCESPPCWRNPLWFLSVGAVGERVGLKVLTPGFPRDDPAEAPAPAHPIPTDVPMWEPRDVPVPEPRDVPVPEPGRVPPIAVPRPDEKNPKPRTLP